VGVGRLLREPDTCSATIYADTGFLDPGEERCISNCRSRPWEPHKYASKAAQDERLPFLLTWVREYYVRGGEMSHSSHAATYAAYVGPKYLFTRAPVLDPPQAEILAWLS